MLTIVGTIVQNQQGQLQFSTELRVFCPKTLTSLRVDQEHIRRSLEHNQSGPGNLANAAKWLAKAATSRRQGNLADAKLALEYAYGWRLMGTHRTRNVDRTKTRSAFQAERRSLRSWCREVGA